MALVSRYRAGVDLPLATGGYRCLTKTQALNIHARCRSICSLLMLIMASARHMVTDAPSSTLATWNATSPPNEVLVAISPPTRATAINSITIYPLIRWKRTDFCRMVGTN